MTPEELLRRVRRMREWADRLVAAMPDGSAIATNGVMPAPVGLAEDVVRELDELERDLLTEVAA